ncbi:MAG: hypothetical protein U9Q17_02000 [Chloroflexota bacterium]|nr:hypothetical protein [Chloroflexota bacterium]
MQLIPSQDKEFSDIPTREREDKDVPKGSDCADYARDLCFSSRVRHAAIWQDLEFLHFIVRNSLLFKSWDIAAVESLDFIARNGGIWHLWGHSWEINEHNDWSRLEDVLGRISALPKGVRKMNNEQLMRMCAARN